MIARFNCAGKTKGRRDIAPAFFNPELTSNGISAILAEIDRQKQDFSK
jgi:hypothetical protein